MTLTDFKKNEKKWQSFWLEKRVFNPKPDKSKKAFYIQAAYPYPSGAMHIGHARTYTITDVIAKFFRLKGFNVLMPMGWHVSGTPVIASVESIKAGNQKVIKKFVENFRIPEKDVKKLSSPKSFVKYMIEEAEYGYKKGFQLLGLGIDWDRELTTIDSQYNKFVEWQYHKLREKGFLGKDRYPVRFCPFHKDPVGDHDLVEGQGVGINEFSVLKFELEKNTFLLCATLRPETVFGQTNVWVNPNFDLEEYRHGKEKWIASKQFFEKLLFQEKNLERIKKIDSKKLIGRMVFAPGINKKVPVLPASFVLPGFGSGIVTSVPSDSPQDYIALTELKKNKEMFPGIKLDSKIVDSIKIIPIIETKKLGLLAGKKAVEIFRVKSQSETEKLEKAKELAYSEGFYKGKMLSSTKRFAGLSVRKAKNLVRQWLEENNQAFKYYELQDRVVCRCNTECVVSVLKNQWFVRYSDSEWKKKAGKTLSGMNIVPEHLRKQYEKVFEWLEDKPCTRSKGLGTRFPFDKKFIVEPLGDSTIYMAYFTLSHLIKKVSPEKLCNKFFDFVFLGKGRIEEIVKKTGIEKKLILDCRKEFDYWYPLAFNASAVELIPNHMSFSIFQHTAIFPENKRQKGTLNLGMLILEGQKMSSSKGNVVLINDLVEKIGADMVRLFLMASVEPWEEMDWKQKEVEKGISKILWLLNFFEENIAKNTSRLTGFTGIDKWLLSEFAFRRKKFFSSMNKFELRKAVQQLTFKFLKELKWYLKRKKTPCKKLVSVIAGEWARCLAPFTPHTCEELWAMLGNNPSIFYSTENKEFDLIERDLSEQLVQRTVFDINEILKITGISKPKKITVFCSSEWKKQALKAFIKAGKPRNKGQAIKSVLKNAKEKKRKAVKLAESFSLKPEEFFLVDDFKVLKNAEEFLSELFKCNVQVLVEKPGLNEKAFKAMPSKPSILVE